MFITLTTKYSLCIYIRIGKPLIFTVTEFVSDNKSRLLLSLLQTLLWIGNFSNKKLPKNYITVGF